MKYLLITALFFASCKSKYDLNREVMHSYFDSSDAAFKYYLKFSNIDNEKSNCYWQMFKKFNDSSDHYYKLCYPNGNPCCGDKKDTIKINCK